MSPAHTEEASCGVTSTAMKLSGTRTAAGCNSGKSIDAEGANPHRVNLSGQGQSIGDSVKALFFYFLKYRVSFSTNKYRNK
jgi:hypothetical protein